MNATIHLPKDTDASTAKNKSIMPEGKIISRTTYSNGLIIETEQDESTVHFLCNRETKTLPNVVLVSTKTWNCQQLVNGESGKCNYPKSAIYSENDFSVWEHFSVNCPCHT